MPPTVYFNLRNILGSRRLITLHLFSPQFRSRNMTYLGSRLLFTDASYRPRIAYPRLLSPRLLSLTVAIHFVIFAIYDEKSLFIYLLNILSVCICLHVPVFIVSFVTHLGPIQPYFAHTILLSSYLILAKCTFID